MVDEYILIKDIYKKLIAQDQLPSIITRKILKDVPNVQTKFNLDEVDSHNLIGEYKRERTSTLNFSKHAGHESKRAHERVFSQNINEDDEFDIYESEELYGIYSASPKEKHMHRSYSNDSGSESSSYFSIGFDCKLKEDGIYIDSCLQTNCFDKISNFQDQLGRRMILGVDWEILRSVIDLQLEDLDTEDDKRCSIPFTYKYIKHQFYEKLMAMNFDLSNKNNSKENYEFIVKSISESKILKKLLIERYSGEEDGVDSEQTFYSSDDSPQHLEFDQTVELKQLNFDISEKKRRMNLINQIIDQDFTFEVELVNQYGAYWGTLAVINGFSSNYNEALNHAAQRSLYFCSNNRILEDTKHCYESKYILRSFHENQKKGNFEILIDFNKISDIMCKNYLQHPIAIELYDDESNQMYFFNFMMPDVRERFLSKN